MREVGTLGGRPREPGDRHQMGDLEPIQKSWPKVLVVDDRDDAASLNRYAAGVDVHFVRPGAALCGRCFSMIIIVSADARGSRSWADRLEQWIAFLRTKLVPGGMFIDRRP